MALATCIGVTDDNGNTYVEVDELAVSALPDKCVGSLGGTWPGGAGVKVQCFWCASNSGGALGSVTADFSEDVAHIDVVVQRHTVHDGDPFGFYTYVAYDNIFVGTMEESYIGPAGPSFDESFTFAADNGMIYGGGALATPPVPPDAAVTEVAILDSGADWANDLTSFNGPSLGAYSGHWIAGRTDRATASGTITHEGGEEFFVQITAPLDPDYFAPIGACFKAHYLYAIETQAGQEATGFNVSLDNLVYAFDYGPDNTISVVDGGGNTTLADAVDGNGLFVQVAYIPMKCNNFIPQIYRRR